jgi:hypothetical protein
MPPGSARATARGVEFVQFEDPDRNRLQIREGR